MPTHEQIITLPESAPSFAVVVERLRVLAEDVQDIKLSLQHMATKEQVAAMVTRNEFERAQWEVAQLRKDHERAAADAAEKIAVLAKESEDRLKTKIQEVKELAERGSVQKFWKDWTTIAATIASTLALIVALTGWRPGQ